MIIVTNSLLCIDDFWDRMNRLVEVMPKAIILREKHLDNDSYLNMATKCRNICEKAGVDFFVNNNIEIAKKMNCPNIHVSFGEFVLNYEFIKKHFSKISVAVHNEEEGIIAEQMGANSVIVGHIFDTDCKKGIKGRGLDFIKKVALKVEIPINAIGGVTVKNFESIMKSGANDACIMSSAMMLSIDEIKNIILSTNAYLN